MTGDQTDFQSRLIALIPDDWLGDVRNVWQAMFAGVASVKAWLYGLIAYAKAQTRIATATDGFLDLIAADFFGTSIQRAPGQSDNSFRKVILANLFRERATRRAVSLIVTQITGYEPIIYEPLRVADNGAYGVPFWGYGVAGAYGSMLEPFQAFVQACRPLAEGIPLVAGYGVSTGAYGLASRSEYASLSDIQGATQDAEIYAAIDSVKPAGTIIWTRITNNPPPIPLDVNGNPLGVNGLPVFYF